MAFNMDPKKCPMPTQDPNVRNKNFKEVALGYTEEMAVNEAKRCVHCKNKPCQTGCPVGKLGIVGAGQRCEQGQILPPPLLDGLALCCKLHVQHLKTRF